MRLIDADAQIEKIEKEIEKYEARIIYLENKKEEEPNNNYNDWNEKIEQCERDILDCKKEIRMLRSYQTAYDLDKVVEKLEELTELAYKRMIDTPSYSPCYKRYSAQYSVRKEFLEIVKGGGAE